MTPTTLSLLMSATASMPARELTRSYVVTLSFHGLSPLAFPDAAAVCDGRKDGFGVFRGVVTRTDHADALQYEGVLQRNTEIGSRVVPAWTPRGRRCHVLLTGTADVKVRIKVARAKSGGGAWIVLTPLDDLATVSGTCSPAERRPIKAAHSERLTFEVGPVLSDGLAPGSYAAQSLEGVGPWAFDVLPLERLSERPCIARRSQSG